MIPEKDQEKIKIPNNERVPEKDPLIRRRGPALDLFRGRRVMHFENGTGFQGGPSRRKGYKLALWSWFASMIDCLILISISSIFMAAFSFLMRTDFGALIGSVTQNQHRVILFLEVFALCAWAYMIVVRSVLGSTVGEWACDLRLGQPQERLRANYILRVAWRSTLILITGLVTLPVLSLILGLDLAGKISGLRLFSLK
ncbi:RDD family protein [Bdellovibrio sp. HCB2-146]|uniref:RDD family protein n=1 Tax=Bdellovibrio sp. HCB2-146 TaxID=3394362 RepID=UPI0039BD7EE2